MLRGIIRGNTFFVLALLTALTALRAEADVLVSVTFFSLSPDPVYISTGEAVFWTDADGGGPYGIHANDASWNTTTDSYGIIFNSPGTFGYYDDNGNTGTIIVTVNVPPTVSITSPSNHAALPAPATFTFAATASDTDVDGLSDVEFYVGTTLTNDIFSAPFTTTVSNLPAGTYTLTAIAYDNANATATNSISITVGTAATTNYILPVVCADIYSSGAVLTNIYLDTAANIHGGLQFAVFDTSPYASILLELNPYALPLFATNVGVYAFDGGTGTFAGSNFNSGTFIGTFVFPANIGYGQVETFDVTSFVRSAKGPYFGFILRGDSGDTFSSLAYNYGTPPELFAVVSTLPPTLAAKQAGNQLIISWPTNNATGLSLQSTTNPVPNATWSPVTNTPALVNGRLTVTNPIAGAKKFFRLSNH